jgi:hypothetical protein
VDQRGRAWLGAGARTGVNRHVSRDRTRGAIVSIRALTLIGCRSSRIWQDLCIRFVPPTELYRLRVEPSDFRSRAESCRLANVPVSQGRVPR